jgi:excisionase family DNA binding protein
MGSTDEILPGPTCTVAEAARLIGISEWALRRAINAGNSPIRAIRVGRRVLIPSAPLRQLLGLDGVS